MFFNYNHLHTFVKSFSFDEFLAFIGTFFYRGLWHKMAVRRPYSNDFSSVYGATLSRNKFQFILQYLSFGSSKARAKKWSRNRFGVFGEFFQHSASNTKTRHFTQWSYYSPSIIFKHFASKNQLPGLSISGTLVENGLRFFGSYVISHVWTTFTFDIFIFIKNLWRFSLLITPFWKLRCNFFSFTY